MLNTKHGPDCGDAEQKFEQVQSVTLDYNRNYRLSDRRRRRVTKVLLPPIDAPLGPFWHRLKIIWRKNLRGAGGFAEACWRHAKKVVLRALARIGPALYNILKTAWSPAVAELLSTKPAPERRNRGDEAGQTHSDTLDYNRTRGWCGGPPPRQSKNWIPRVALVEAIALALLIVNGYAGGGFLRVPGMPLPSKSATAGTQKVLETAGLAIAWTINDVIAGAFHGSGGFQSATVAGETSNRYRATSGANSSSSDSRSWTSSWLTLNRSPSSGSSGDSPFFRALAGLFSTHNSNSSDKWISAGSNAGGHGTGSGAGTSHASGSSAILPTAGAGAKVAGGANTNSQKTVPNGGGNAGGLVTNSLVPLAAGADITSGNSAASTQTGIGTTASTIGGLTSGSGAGGADPDGTWIHDGNGNWSTTADWSGGIVADGGGFANFSALNITGNRTVTINATSRTVRRIDIGDTNGTNSYTIAANGGASLIFDNTANSANAQLNEVLNSNGDTISAPIVLNSSLDITNVSAPAATLTLSGAITSGTAGTKTITTSTGAVTISGVIGNGSGTVAVTQNGSGILTLSGTNTFSGLLTVQNGTLSIATINNSASNGVLGNSSNAVVLGGSGTTGTLEYTGATASSTKKFTMATGGTGVFQVDANTLTLSGVIDGGGALTKSGAGTLTLSGANIYTGATNVSAGVLNIQNATALGTTAAGTTVSSGAALQIQNNIAVGAEALTLNGSGISNTGALRNISGTNSWSGAITLGSASTIGSDAGNLTLSGIISGSFALSKAGAGTLTLTGANTYTGTTTISAGTLQLGSGGTTGSLSTSSTITDNGNFTINQSDAVIQGTDFSGSAITGTGSLTQAGTGTTTLNAANTYTGATTVSAGILNIQNDTALGTTAAGTTVSSGATLQLQGGITVGAEALNISGTGATGGTGALENVSGTNNYGGLVTLGATSTISSDSGTLNLNGAVNAVNLNGHGLTVNGSGKTLISGVITGAGATSTLTKSGSGALRLTAANNYSGPTTVNGGTLLLNNTSGSGTGNGTVTVNNGGTLGGTGGAISGGGPVTVNAGANLSPGNGGYTTGVFTVKGTLTLQPTSNFLIDINGTTPGTGYDQLQVTVAGGAGGAVITGSNLIVHVTTTLTVGEQFTIAHHAGGYTGQFAQGSSVTDQHGDVFSIDYSGGPSNYDIVLTTQSVVTVVPEPSTWIGGALAVAALAYTQRRKLKKLFLLRRAYGGQVVSS